MSVVTSQLLSQLQKTVDLIPSCYFGANPNTKTLDQPKFSGILSEFNSTLVNWVHIKDLSAQFEAEDMDALIDAYKSAGLSFTILFGEHHPESLRHLLEQYNFTHAATFLGMIKAVTPMPLSIDAGLEVVAASHQDRDEFIELCIKAYPFDRGAAEFFTDNFYLAKDFPFDLDLYLVRDLKTGQAVSFGSMVNLPDMPIGLLNGAATLPEYRGRGCYKALLAARLEQAQTRNYSHVMLQALSNTSAPICARNGFEQFYQQEMFCLNIE